MGDEYSYIGAVVGATYPEMGKVLRKVMPKSYILVPGYGAQGGQGKDLVHFFNEDGLGAIVNSSVELSQLTSRKLMQNSVPRISEMHQEQLWKQWWQTSAMH